MTFYNKNKMALNLVNAIIVVLLCENILPKIKILYQEDRRFSPKKYEDISQLSHNKDKHLKTISHKL